MTHEYEPQEGIDYIIDLYAVAGADQEASDQELKKALNERAMEYHPDRLEGTAPEFRDKGARVARLLNRAREILLDPKKRDAYNEILGEWDGPVSEDGTPMMTLTRWHEVELQGKSPEEVEALFGKKVTQIVSMTGYSPSRLAFLEKMIEESGDSISDELRAEYEDALLQKDRALAIEEAERSSVLGLPDIAKQNFVATLDYGEQTSAKIEAAKAKKEADLERLALGGIGTKLALLAGETTEETTDLAAQSATPLELPAYYNEQAQKVQGIADQRADLTDKRLSNFVPTYPEAELQTELQEHLIIGMSFTGETVWLGAKIDVENDSADSEEASEELQAMLAAGDYRGVIERGFGIVIAESMENIDVRDLLEVAIAKYTDRYKK